MSTSEAAEKNSAHLAAIHRILCPNCSARMTRDFCLGVMKCPYCGTTTAAIADDTPADDIPRHDLESSPFYTGDPDQKKEQPQHTGNDSIVLHCSGCGSAIAFDPKREISICPSCGSAQVTKQSKPMLPPDGILPVQLSREQVHTVIHEWLTRQPGIPAQLTRETCKITIEGFYVPYWVFDGLAKISYECKQGVQSDSSLTISRTGKIDLPFKDIMVAAEPSLEKQLGKLLSGWSMEKVVPYRQDLAGTLNVLRYGVELTRGYHEAQQKLMPLIKEAACKDADADNVWFSSGHIEYKDQTFRQILVPVWIGKYQFNNVSYQVIVNDYTKQIGGRHPKIEPVQWQYSYARKEKKDEYLIPKIIIGLLLGLLIGFLRYSVSSSNNSIDNSTPSSSTTHYHQPIVVPYHSRSGTPSHRTARRSSR
jgi:uncharacterized CHY-type Zn-finger protein